MTSGPKNTNRLGYTLLEVILASMLAAVVMLIIATSIEIQLRAFKAGRSNVEEAQLARVLLHRIGDDLRALMPAEEVAVANEDAASEESSESKKSESDSDTDSGLADDEDDDSGALDDETTAGESNLGGATPGVYGELDKLRIDVVRAKRPADSASEELPSDADTSSVAMSQNSGGIKTIVYYVLSPEETGVGSVSTDSDQSAGGLVRRQLVGPTAAWAAENGLLEYHDTTITPIAPEVTAVEFRYHDGQEWLESWDSSASGQLPKAFEIRLFFARPAPF
ncbi:MAG: hypothetical protein U9N87_14280, partial [Planctomycetota bacterium]|nr:hypothetical protein [Planctomycetota bacterium]